MKGAVLGFDFGEMRIGVAVGDWEMRLAHPLATIVEVANSPRFARIGEMIQEWRPVELVVGLPMHLDGAEHDLSRRCRRFANQLNGRFGLQVRLVDERLTSAEAAVRLRANGLSGRDHKAALDSLAAQEILQDFFSSQP